MAITITDIRNLGGNDSILFDSSAQGGSGALKTAGVLHRLKCFFGIGSAIDRNKATVAAIRDAILASGDFAAQDLQDAVRRMLDKVSTDRAIGAAEIKGIMMKLDSLASSSSLLSRVTLHVAARGISPDAAPCGDTPVQVAQQLVLREYAAGTNPGAVDVAALAGDAMDACGRAIRSVQPRNGRPEPELVDFVATRVRRFILNPNGSLRTPQEISDAVSHTCDFFRNAMAAAGRLGPQSHPDAASLDATTRRRAKTRDSILNFLNSASPVDSRLFGVIENHIRNVPLHELRSLPANATTAQILGALRAFARAVQPSTLDLPANVQAPSMPGWEEALMRFICRWAALEMPQENRRALLDLLDSVAGGKAVTYPARIADADLEYGAIRELEDFLRELEDRPAPDRAARMEVPLAELSPSDRCAYRPGDAFGGNAAPQLRDAILGGAGIPVSGADSAKRLHERIDEDVRSILNGNFASAMKELGDAIKEEFAEEADPEITLEERFDDAFADGFSQFATTLSGGTPRTFFQMPDGSLLPSDDPAHARDVLARVATGRADAEYASLSDAERAKANVLIALVSCDPFEAAERGIPTSLSANRDTRAFTVSSQASQKIFQLSGSAGDGFVIRCGTSHQIGAVSFGSGDAHRTLTGAGIYSSLMEIRLSPDDMESLAEDDYWPRFDDSEFQKEMHKDELDIERLSRTVRPEFGFTGEVSASFSLDLDTPQPAPASQADA